MSFVKTSLQALYLYPVKSCRGIPVDEMHIDRHGPRGDRQWMIVDEEGVFVTQREMAKLAQIETRLEGGSLELLVEGQSLGRTGDSADVHETRAVRVWKSDLTAHLEKASISQALSSFLGKTVFLVRHGSNSERPVIAGGEDRGAFTRFSDSFPVMMANRESLRDLNTRLKVPVGMDRFRPNFEVDLSEAFREDSIRSIETESGFIFEFGRGCSRCVMINRDQKTGEAREGAEPLATLAGYRRKEGKVYFGVHLLPRFEGVIRRGESLKLHFA